MRNNYLTRSIPFISILLIIIFFNITNQKEITKLKILIWETPTSTLGRYLSISTATGFILSFLITTNLAKLSQSKLDNVIEYKSPDKKDESYELYRLFWFFGSFTHNYCFLASTI